MKDSRAPHDGTRLDWVRRCSVSCAAAVLGHIAAVNVTKIGSSLPVRPGRINTPSDQGVWWLPQWQAQGWRCARSRWGEVENAEPSHRSGANGKMIHRPTKHRAEQRVSRGSPSRWAALGARLVCWWVTDFAVCAIVGVSCHPLPTDPTLPASWCLSVWVSVTLFGSSLPPFSAPTPHLESRGSYWRTGSIC